MPLNPPIKYRGQWHCRTLYNRHSKNKNKNNCQNNYTIFSMPDFDMIVENKYQLFYAMSIISTSNSQVNG